MSCEEEGESGGQELGRAATQDAAARIVQRVAKAKSLAELRLDSLPGPPVPMSIVRRPIVS